MVVGMSGSLSHSGHTNGDGNERYRWHHAAADHASKPSAANQRENCCPDGDCFKRRAHRVGEPDGFFCFEGGDERNA